MPSRAERRRELRAAGYRRSADKRGRRGSNRIATLEPTSVARAEAERAVEAARAKAVNDAIDKARAERLLVPGDTENTERTESGLIVPKAKP